MLKKILKDDRGWTFIETIIGMAIVLILSAGVGVVAFKNLDKANVTAAKSQIGDLKLALELYRQDCSRYPTVEQGLESLWTKPIMNPVPSGWNGPYIDKELPSDPWDNDYIYTVPGENGLAFSISSYGADGTPGGEGNDSDIHSWQ